MGVRQAKNPLLHRYWIEFDQPPPETPPPGEIWVDGPDSRLVRACGVTAYTPEDALELARRRLFADGALPPVKRVVHDVDVRELDQGHVVPNMGVPIWRGVWWPNYGAEER